MRPRNEVVVALVLASVTGGPRTVAAQDTVVVHADGPPLWGSDVQLVETARIGMLEGPEEYVFGAVGALAVGPNGSIYVYDRQVPIIRAYDASGRHVRNVGREGQGPGEYRQILGMHALRNGDLAIWDPGNMRITVYDSTGTYLTSHRVPSALYTANVFGIDTAGHYYVKAVDPPRGGDRRMREGPRGVTIASEEPPTTWIRVSPNGELVDSIPLPPTDASSSFVLMTSEGARTNFSVATCYAWSPLGYLVVGRNDRYLFDLLLPDGPVRRVVRDFEPVALHAEERAQWEAWAAFFARRGGEEYSVPRTKPAYRGLEIDVDGRIWVDRYAPAVRRAGRPREPGDERPTFHWRQQATYDVFDPDGTYLGTLIVPENTSLWIRQGDQAWGVTRGEFDEQYIVRFLIQGASQ